MNSSRPYIIRAIYEWIVDNECTPHLLIDATYAGVFVPESYVSDGQIVLNIAPSAVVSLQMGNDTVAFNGRFGGQPQDVEVPVASILGIYARENGQGMVFDGPMEPDPDPEPPYIGEPSPNDRGSRPALKIVK
ncbi:ClpXP protease specificity-enhancing factor [Luminiphilus sp.]|nr:ClpXP protease specificity-enhancing factor [Luminiphilus sp.]MDG1011437.1 ClpXP protease specificity-enhancing factor [Luminiphilus sp.]